MATTKKQTTEVRVEKLMRKRIVFHLRGASPLLFNTYSEDVMRNSILPPRTRTKLERETTLKHNPFVEFRNAAHWLESGSPTLLALPATAFKGSMMDATKDAKGLFSTQVGRNLYVHGQLVPIWGIPKMHMTMVRNKGSRGSKGAPDVRTRIIIEEWATTIDVSYTSPALNRDQVAGLAGRACLTIGVGDGRPGCGKLDFGRSEIVEPNDKDYKRIVRTGGFAPQLRAMEAAEPYNQQTRGLIEWFRSEAEARGWRFDRNGYATYDGPAESVEAQPAKTSNRVAVKATGRGRRRKS